MGSKRELSNIRTIAGVSNKTVTADLLKCNKTEEMVLEFRVGDVVKIAEMEEKKKAPTFTKGKIVGFNERFVLIKTKNYTTSYRTSQLFYKDNLEYSIIN